MLLYHLAPPECPIYAPNICIYLIVKHYVMIGGLLGLKALECIFRYLLAYEILYLFLTVSLFIYFRNHLKKFNKFCYIYLLKFLSYVILNLFITKYFFFF
jgi:hypothetical protein